MYLVLFSVKYAAFSVYLYNEIYLCYHWFHIFSAGSYRNISSYTAYYAFLAAFCRIVFQRLATFIHWLLEHKYLGPYIRSFREDRAIPLRAKIISVSLLWITAIHCVLFLFPYWWLKGIMAVVTIGVTIYILSFKTRSPR